MCQKHLIFLFFLLSFPSASLFSQITVPERGQLFRDDVIPRVDIIMPADSVAELYLEENESSSYHYHATFIFNNGTVNDTIENIGFRLRGNTSRHSDKKSFKISFNTYEEGRKYRGVEKMNLNGEHNDPSVMRSKICWDLYRDMKLPATRANYVRLYINDVYFGLYINIEHIDEEYIDLRFGNKDGNLYKCLWPADLSYEGLNPDLYKEIPFGTRRTYDLKTNTELDDYSDLAHFINVLNNLETSNISCELEKVFNVDDYLKYLVIDVCTGNWDGPIFNINNFYLYHNTATDKIEYIPYDLDNTLGIDWFGIDWETRDIYNWTNELAPHPLYSKILAVQEYRDRYSYYMAEFQANFFNEEHLFPKIDGLKALINTAIITDTFRTLDYGFSYNDFLSSFDGPIPYNHTGIGLKPYITTRHETTENQLEINNIRPVISNIQNNHPSQNQDISISARFFDDGILMNGQVCYAINEENIPNCTAVFDDGQHNDGLANDGIYGAIIPAIDGAQTFNYYIEVTDEEGQRSRQPRCERTQIIINPNTLQLYINEFMASNDTTIMDEAGEFDDWLELYYTGTEPLYLGDKYLSDNEAIPNKWLMPDITISAGEHLLFWADNDEEQGDRHTNFKLSASGEFIGVFDHEENNFALIDGYTFSNQQTDIAFGRIPDGTGAFQEVEATPAAMNEPLTEVHFVFNEDVFLVYPNPISDYFTIECPAGSTKQWTAELMDPLGRILFTKKLESTINFISISHLSLKSGIYFLNIMNEGRKIKTIPLGMMK